jgi:hypothetical protein
LIRKLIPLSRKMNYMLKMSVHYIFSFIPNEEILKTVILI